MSVNVYTVDDLQEVEQIAHAKAEKLGLSVPDVMFHLVQPEEMYDIAARGLPGRYSHWSFGREYEKAKSEYDKGRGRIYELVINTRPINAYLMDGNSLIAQLLVMAHVYGHATVYEHNRYFEPADKNILSRTRAAAGRIENYYGEYGRTRVEDFIDSCVAVEYQRSFDQMGKSHTAKEPEWENKPYDLLFPDETAKRKEEFKKAREEFKQRFPKQPEKDFLGFFEQHARHLEAWQRDVISIIRMEMDYFTPMMKITTLHEAQAVYYHNTIVQEMMAEDPRFDDDAFTEFQSMNARVLHPKLAHTDLEGNPVTPDTPRDEILVHCADINPYLTGYEGIYKEVKRICEDPTDEDKERWWWAGEATWDEKRIDLVKAYDDASLLAEFLTPAVCERSKLFIEPRTLKQYNDLRILEDEAEEVKKHLVKRQTTFGIPTVEIVDADWKRRGELYLVHNHEDGMGLDDEYTKGTLQHLSELWGHTVTVRTIKSNKEDPKSTEPLWFRVKPGEITQTYTSEPQ